MKKKTCDLTTEEINFAVAYLEKVEVDINSSTFDDYLNESCDWNPCFHWSQGGPIIERERIHLDAWDDKPNWLASSGDVYIARDNINETGTTPLIAAMRYYVLNKLGSEVDMQEIFRDLQIKMELHNE